MKGNPKESMGARIFTGCFGILWTILAFSITADSPWPIVSIIFPGFGILFTIAGFMGLTGKNSSSGDDEGTAGKSETTPQRQERPAAPREKKTVFCPYCGTALEEDYKICGSCGAPRKSK